MMLITEATEKTMMQFARKWKETMYFLCKGAGQYYQLWKIASDRLFQYCISLSRKSEDALLTISVDQKRKIVLAV